MLFLRSISASLLVLALGVGAAQSEPSRNQIEQLLERLMPEHQDVADFTYKVFPEGSGSYGRISVAGRARLNEDLYERGDNGWIKAQLSKQGLPPREVDYIVAAWLRDSVRSGYSVSTRSGQTRPFTVELDYEERVEGFAFSTRSRRYPDFDGVPRSRILSTDIVYGDAKSLQLVNSAVSEARNMLAAYEGLSEVLRQTSFDLYEEVYDLSESRPSGNFARVASVDCRGRNIVRLYQRLSLGHDVAELSCEALVFEKSLLLKQEAGRPFERKLDIQYKNAKLIFWFSDTTLPRRFRENGTFFSSEFISGSRIYLVPTGAPLPQEAQQQAIVESGAILQKPNITEIMSSFNSTVQDQSKTQVQQPLGALIEACLKGGTGSNIGVYTVTTPWRGADSLTIVSNSIDQTGAAIEYMKMVEKLTVCMGEHSGDMHAVTFETIGGAYVREISSAGNSSTLTASATSSAVEASIIENPTSEENSTANVHSTPGMLPWEMADENAENILALDGNAVRDIQARLLVLGHDPNGIDGRIGKGTRTAVSAWQVSYGIPVTGFLDERQLTELRSVSETALQDWLQNSENRQRYEGKASTTSRNGVRSEGKYYRGADGCLRTKPDNRRGSILLGRSAACNLRALGLR